MNQNQPSCKSFAQNLADNPYGLPPLLAGLLAGKQLYAHLNAVDLREIAKFTEIPNLAGLAAHRVERPAPDEIIAGLLRSGAGPIAAEPALPIGVSKTLVHGLSEHPCILVRGRLAGAGPSPILVQYLVAQPYAHLAAGFQRLLWPLPLAEGQDAAAGQPAYTLFHWPEPLLKKGGGVILEELVAHWIGPRLGLIIGFDDPWLPAQMLLDAARRQWQAAGQGAALRYEGPLGEPSFVAGEGCAPAASPVWADPLLPAAALAASEPYRAAALALGALPFGVAVDDEGRFPLFEGDPAPANAAESGWLVLPRSALA